MMASAVSTWPGRLPGVWRLLLPALALTLLNSVKPMTIDDVSYYYRAIQLDKHPLDPYGGEPFWDLAATPSIKAFIPPVLCYWWAAGIRLFGDNEFLWKCWLFPLALLLVRALDVLLRRFAAGAETPLVWLITISPIVLPSLNYMLDIPALAVLLTAVTAFLRAIDDRRLGLAVLAGLIAGLAMQTKYTGVTAVAAILIYGLLTGRWKPALWAAAAAAAVFVAWEALTYANYGESQFVTSVTGRAHRTPWSGLVLPLVTIVGCVAPALVPLGLIARGAAGRWIAGSIALLAGVYAILALVPVAQTATASHDHGIFLHNFTVDLIGLPLWGIAGVVIWREYLRRWRSLEVADRFLVLWLAVEIVFYFPLSPFAAVRRVVTLTIVLTLLLARVAARRLRQQPQRRWQLQAAAIFGVAVGLLFWGVDCYDSRAQKAAVAHAETYLPPPAQRGTVWFIGYWGFQYYAHQAGMKPVVFSQSQLHTGDWLVVARQEAGYVPKLGLDFHKLSPVADFANGGRLPLSTQCKYYDGKHPLMHRYQPQVNTVVYQVTGDFTLPPEKE
jgi:hypothetical protein